MSEPAPTPAAPWAEARVVDRLRDGGPALVALSGGVDSSLVASLVHEARPSGSLAVTLEGPAVARSEVARARRIAEAIGIEHAVVSVDPLVRPEYVANPADRCFFCRSVEVERFVEIGRARGLQRYLDGLHADDLREWRPGRRAMDAAGFLHPLADAGWTKERIRAAARDRGLPNWDEPSDACLASRVAHGQPISRELLGRIETAEAWLRSEGFRRVRVRVEADRARVEVDPGEVARLLAEPLATQVCARIARLGFSSVHLDPRGYHGGPLAPTVRA